MASDETKRRRSKMKKLWPITPIALTGAFAVISMNCGDMRAEEIAAINASCEEYQDTTCSESNIIKIVDEFKYPAALIRQRQEKGQTLEKIIQLADDGLGIAESRVLSHIPSEKIKLFQNAGFSIVDIDELHKAGMTIDLAQQYRRIGCKSAYESITLNENGITPKQAKPYITAGINDLDGILKLPNYIKNKLTPHEAALAYQYKVSVPDINYLKKEGIDLKKGCEFIKAGFYRWHAERYINMGISLTEARKAKELGLGPGDYEDLKENGLTLSQAEPYIKAGIFPKIGTYAHDIKECVEAKFPPEKVVAYQREGIKNMRNAIGLDKANISPSEAGKRIREEGCDSFALTLGECNL